MTAAAHKEREIGARTYRDIEPLDESDAQLVNAAQRCLMAALDHSKARKIRETLIK